MRTNVLIVIVIPILSAFAISHIGVIALLAWLITQHRNWPLQDIHLVRGLCTRIDTITRKHLLRLDTPLAPFITHVIAQYSAPPRPSCIAIHAIQYWQWQYRVKANIASRCRPWFYGCD